MENSYVAAVDLGTTKVIIAVAKKDEKNKVEIVAVREHASKGVIKGDLRNNEQAFAALSEAKRQIEEELQIVISEVYIGISGQHIKCAKATGNIFVQSSEHQISEVKATDVKRLIDEMHNSALPAGTQIISVLPQTYKIDNEADIVEPVGMEGKRLEAEFNLIMGETLAIDRIKRCFHRANMAVLGITLQPLASSYAVLSEDEKELGVAVVDIGGGTTDLCIYHDKIIRHIAVLPVGGDEVNRDIKSYGILDRHLEKLKTKFGEAVSDKAPDQKFITIPSISGQAPKEISVRALAEIIEARMFDIIDFVGKQLDASGYRGKLGAGIVLTGGGSTLKNLSLLFRRQLNCEERVASPNQHLTAESVEKVNDPKYSTIAGILIDSIRTGKVSKIESTREPEPEPIPVPETPVAEPTRSTGFTQAPVSNPEQTPVQPVDSTTPTKEEQEAAALEAQRKAYEANQRAEEEDAKGYGDDDEEYYDEEDITARTPKKGIFGRLKGVFGRMFEPDEVDADE